MCNEVRHRLASVQRGGLDNWVISAKVLVRRALEPRTIVGSAAGLILICSCVRAVARKVWWRNPFHGVDGLHPVREAINIERRLRAVITYEI